MGRSHRYYRVWSHKVGGVIVIMGGVIGINGGGVIR